MLEVYAEGDIWVFKKLSFTCSQREVLEDLKISPARRLTMTHASLAQKEITSVKNQDQSRNEG